MANDNHTPALTIDGLQVTTNGTTHTFCPKATCALLEQTEQIEGFDIDQNGEPVILHTDPNYPNRYGYTFWCDFVKYFTLTTAMAATLIQMKQGREEHKATQAKIVSMLAPLRAA